MKFIADSMLGRPARWLRLLGYDTLYFPHIDDSLLLRIAREEERALLTRDTRLVKVRGLKNYLLLKANDPFEQLKEIIAAFDLKPLEQSGESIEGGGTPPLHMYRRCSVCNTPLVDVPKKKAKPFVPEYVFLTVTDFRRCPECDKFYWKGTHEELFKKKLEEIFPS